MLVRLTRPLSECTTSLLAKTLKKEDGLLLTTQTLLFARAPTKFICQGYVRESDAKLLGSPPHSDWIIIDDAQWVALTKQHQPCITW